MRDQFDPMSDQLSGGKLTKRLKRLVLGDPRSVPGRIIKLTVASLIAVLIVSVWAVSALEIGSRGSSLWLLRTVFSILKQPWILPPIIIYVYLKYVGVRRGRDADETATVTGWLPTSVKRLSDEVRSTDHTTRVITTTDHTLEEIESHVDAGLDDKPHTAESVDYWGRGVGDGGDKTPALPPTLALPAGEERAGDTNVDGDGPSTSDPSPRGWRARIGHGGKRLASGVARRAFRVAFYPLGLLLVVVDRVLPDEQFDEEEEAEIPWRVRVAEELKHFVLDLAVATRSDDIIWQVALPAGIAFAVQLLAFKVWVSPLLFVAICVDSALIGFGYLALSKKRRSRRLAAYRSPESTDYWEDVAGRVKTVETADVTCYVGFTNGRRFATYDREEFIREFSLRLHQYVQGEKVAPSIMEQYARNIVQMKPNLSGHLEGVEKPAIENAIIRTVSTAEDQLIEKAHLAEAVIERYDAGRWEQNLGHDPKLVGDTYREMVEYTHELSEIDVPIPDASGGETMLTVVYPTEKTRLPEASRLHAQFSDRFTGLHGEPHYELPEVDATEDLAGFTPSYETMTMFPSAKAALPEGETI